MKYLLLTNIMLCHVLTKLAVYFKTKYVLTLFHVMAVGGISPWGSLHRGHPLNRVGLTRTDLSHVARSFSSSRISVRAKLMSHSGYPLPAVPSVSPGWRTPAVRSSSHPADPLPAGNS